MLQYGYQVGEPDTVDSRYCTEYVEDYRLKSQGKQIHEYTYVRSCPRSKINKDQQTQVVGVPTIP